MKAAGGIAGVGAVGGTGLFATTRGASAGAGFDFSDTVSISSDDGSVEYVAIYGDSVVSWDGFDTSAKYFSIDIELTVVGGADDGTDYTKEIHSTGNVDLDNSDWGDNESLPGSGTSGTINTAVGQDSNGDHDPASDWHIVGTDPEHGYGLPSDPVAASYLEVGEDGKTVDETLEMASTYTWYDSSENELFSETFTSKLDVSVTNEPESATASSGDGSDGALGA